MSRWYKTDLHIHTCLSPCADILMSPRKIIAEVLRQQIDIIAITDHNSAENAAAVIRAAAGSGILVLPGMEVCTSEEVHVLAIFDNCESARRLQTDVYNHLTGTNDPKAFGLQVVANEHDQVEWFEKRLLIGAADISIENVVAKIHALGGLAIAAHIDREGFGIIGHLGFIPDRLGLDALELSARTGDTEAAARFPGYRQCMFIRNSDAHFLNQLGKNVTGFFLEEPSFDGIQKALHSNNPAVVKTGEW